MGKSFGHIDGEVNIHSSNPHEAGQEGQMEKSLFTRFLRLKKLKLTRQREAVFNIIFSGEGHFEAEELVHQLKNGPVRVSRATVYRTMELLRECQLVQKLELGGTGSLYEQVQPGGHHDHLICLGCGRVIEFHDDKLERMQGEICRGYDFAETHHSLRIFGKCGQCRGTA